MNDPYPYRSLSDARLNDSTVCRMMLMNSTMSEIVVQLANEKVQLIRELADAKMRNPPPIILHAIDTTQFVSPPHHTQ